MSMGTAIGTGIGVLGGLIQGDQQERSRRDAMRYEALKARYSPLLGTRGHYLEPINPWAAPVQGGLTGASFAQKNASLWESNKNNKSPQNQSTTGEDIASEYGYKPGQPNYNPNAYMSVRPDLYNPYDPILGGRGW